MRKEKISWWWFLFIAGIIIPFFEILINHEIAYPGILHSFFVEGMNPVFGKIFYFLLISIAFIFFRLTYKIKNSGLSRFVYVIFGLAVLLLIFPFYVFDKYAAKNENVRSWVSYNPVRQFPQTIFSSNNFWDITLMIIFLFFLIVNFPMKRKEPSD